MAHSPSLAGAPSGSSLSLFANQIAKFVILLVGFALCVIIGVQITNSDTNALATFAMYVGAATFIIATISPRLGIYLVLFMCPSIDLVKRFLILFSTISMSDVASVLAVTPITLAGAVTGMVFDRFIFRRRSAVPGERNLFLIVSIVCSLLVVTGLLHNEDSKLKLLQELAESCIYVTLVMLVPIYFSTPEEMATLMRRCLTVFLPVAFYGFWQQFAGLSDFEWRYLLSGLTTTSEDFVGSARVFSTLNSNHSFSVTMACCAVIALIQRHQPAASRWQEFLKRRAWWMFLIFTAATLISLRRTGWLVILFSLAGAFCFRTRTRTLVFYTACLAGGLTIFFNTDYFYARLPVWEGAVQALVPGHDQAIQLQTFNDRLLSFQTLRQNAEMWTAFGLPAAQRDSFFVHDALSQTIVYYGVVGLLAFFGLIVWSLRLGHKLVWKTADPSQRSYAALLLALVFSNLFVGVLMQSHISIFPINFIFWACAGALLKITFDPAPVAVAPKIVLENATQIRLKHPFAAASRLPMARR